jgi:hypothetical protein
VKKVLAFDLVESKTKALLPVLFDYWARLTTHSALAWKTFLMDTVDQRLAGVCGKITE